ncbi:Uu.00g060570.m01.CDS01 [Anthostomella pinea]|uniref:Uu.00g060570.m01.CDS01 n=1 Tax=Anthostomella pinea TaxID=933095 RepID=A0AAI8YMF5_9PEZI|nr:Uu.00g060570.m01.CDS01 [Anthostomella pinea]
MAGQGDANLAEQLRLARELQTSFSGAQPPRPGRRGARAGGRGSHQAGGRGCYQASGEGQFQNAPTYGQESATFGWNNRPSAAGRGSYSGRGNGVPSGGFGQPFQARPAASSTAYQAAMPGRSAADMGDSSIRAKWAANELVTSGSPDADRYFYHQQPRTSTTGSAQTSFVHASQQRPQMVDHDANTHLAPRTNLAQNNYSFGGQESSPTDGDNVHSAEARQRLPENTPPASMGDRNVPPTPQYIMSLDGSSESRQDRQEYQDDVEMGGVEDAQSIASSCARLRPRGLNGSMWNPANHQHQPGAGDIGGERDNRSLPRDEAVWNIAAHQPRAPAAAIPDQDNDSMSVVSTDNSGIERRGPANRAGPKVSSGLSIHEAIVHWTLARGTSTKALASKVHDYVSLRQVSLSREYGSKKQAGISN